MGLSRVAMDMRRRQLAARRRLSEDVAQVVLTEVRDTPPLRSAYYEMPADDRQHFITRVALGVEAELARRADR